MESVQVIPHTNSTLVGPVVLHVHIDQFNLLIMWPIFGLIYASNITSRSLRDDAWFWKTLVSMPKINIYATWVWSPKFYKIIIIGSKTQSLVQLTFSFFGDTCLILNPFHMKKIFYSIYWKLIQQLGMTKMVGLNKNKVLLTVPVYKRQIFSILK